jgi:hypothetical protein
MFGWFEKRDDKKEREDRMERMREKEIEDALLDEEEETEKNSNPWGFEDEEEFSDIEEIEESVEKSPLSGNPVVPSSNAVSAPPVGNFKSISIPNVKKKAPPLSPSQIVGTSKPTRGPIRRTKKKRGIKVFARLTNQYAWVLFFSKETKETHKLRMPREEANEHLITIVNNVYNTKVMKISEKEHIIFNHKWMLYYTRQWPAELWDTLIDFGFEHCEDEHIISNPKHKNWS